MKYFFCLAVIFILTGCVLNNQSTNDSANYVVDPSLQQASSTHIFADGIPDRITFGSDLQLAITSPLQRVSFSTDQWYFFSSDVGSHQLVVIRGTESDFKNSCLLASYSWLENIEGMPVQFCKGVDDGVYYDAAFVKAAEDSIILSGVNISIQNLKDIIATLGYL